MLNGEQTRLVEWTAWLERRYLANLRLAEVTRALRALSSTYVERRDHGARQHVHGALDTAGKRAAFALYYAPLHFMAVAEIVRAVGATDPAPSSIIDLGCGTGVAGVAWALAAAGRPTVVGMDRHPWAVAESRSTLRHFGVRGRVVIGDVARFRPHAGASAVAAYTLNELSDLDRRHVEARLLELPRHGGRVLLLEPLARRVAPWWSDLAERTVMQGGRVDEWRLTIDPPPIVQQLGAAAGLSYRELRLQSLFL